ncbi:hypothetical protein NA56DRAFT_708325 [Hyaloscypha hepaticicola]|uniref:Uncharacterized protein n=1 Tax=Hyaloscypha hepaticicola TaxID=2082293 RepID=A0A2J6PRV7_9HELO|nr:hypothetical protein NA56DRAFT_708325 [Hyaloscypha hepaticicola]
MLTSFILFLSHPARGGLIFSFLSITFSDSIYKTQRLTRTQCRIVDLPPAEAGWMHQKELKKHDVIAMRGTNHEWVSRGKELARLFVVLVPSKEVVTDEGMRLEKTPAGEIFGPTEEED